MKKGCSYLGCIVKKHYQSVKEQDYSTQQNALKANTAQNALVCSLIISDTSKDAGDNAVFSQQITIFECNDLVKLLLGSSATLSYNENYDLTLKVDRNT